MENVIKKFFGEIEPNKIFTYQEFMKHSEKIVEKTDFDTLDEEGKKNYEYRKINLQRSNRIQITFKANDNLVELVNNIKEPQTWLVVTEDWCGDSAQILPYIIKYLEHNELIDVFIILRDDNLEAIDLYFTEGNPRSIPKIIGFDGDANELFVWGPRPKFAQDLVQQLKSEGYSKEEFNKELHLWYGRSRGKELEKELFSIFKNLQPVDAII